VNSESRLLGNSKENSIKEKIRNVLSTIKSTILDSFHKIYQPVKLLGISMGNTIRSGETVALRIRRANAQAKYRVGDLIQVVSGDITYIHRIVKVDIQFGETIYYTQGDNRLTNPIVDPKITEDQIIGKVHMSKRAIDKALTRIKNGETTIAHALGMTITKGITSSHIIGEMNKILQGVYESTIKGFSRDVEAQFKGDLDYDTFSKSLGPKFDYIAKNEKLIEPELLNAFLSVLHELRRIEDDASTRRSYTNAIKDIKAYAIENNIPIKYVSPYAPEFSSEAVRGALVLDHINKFAGFDLLFGEQFSDSIFEQTKVKDKKGQITYILQHFRLSIEPFIRKQSISTKDILTTNNKYHQEYDRRLTEQQTEQLIGAWNELMAEGLKKGEITAADIRRIFNDVIVGKGSDKGIVYLKYNWNCEKMKNDINEFLDKKLNNELDEYIEEKWKNLYERWRMKQSNNGLTIEEQINEVYSTIRSKYLGKEMKYQLSI
ncbi:MAG: S26 family signal peptidase, partial [Promethearchaeota archaeon]